MSAKPPDQPPRPCHLCRETFKPDHPLEIACQRCLDKLAEEWLTGERNTRQANVNTASATRSRNVNQENQVTVFYDLDVVWGFRVDLSPYTKKKIEHTEHDVPRECKFCPECGEPRVKIVECVPGDWLEENGFDLTNSVVDAICADDGDVDECAFVFCAEKYNPDPFPRRADTIKRPDPLPTLEVLLRLGLKVSMDDYGLWLAGTTTSG